MKAPALIAAVSIAFALICAKGIAAPDEANSPWKQEQLTESFMRSLTKQNCMAKTIASLKNNCDTDACLKTLAGITGDCTTWASGDEKAFCLNYTHDYIARYCASNELTARQCVLLHATKPMDCAQK